MITIYGRNTSSNVQAVMWAIGELGLEHERLDYGHSFGGVDTSDYLAMNPNGLVPTLVDGDNPPLWESNAILRYLGRAYGQGGLWPDDIVVRSQTDKWMDWTKSAMYSGFMMPIFWQLVRVAKADRDEAKVEKSLASFQKTLMILEHELEGKQFLMGDDLTLADISVGHILFRIFELKANGPSLANLEAYYGRLSARPAYRKHVAVSFEPLRVEGA